MPEHKHVFRGELEGDQFWPDDEDRWLKTMAHFYGKPVIVTIGEEREHRSLSANAYLWGPVYQEFSEYTGHTKEEVHFALKCKILGVIDTPLGPMPKRGTHDMDSVEFSDFVIRVKAEAASLGIVLPQEDEVA